MSKGHWEGEEFVTTAAGGVEIRLPYEMHDHCGFRASQLNDIVWSFKVSDILEDGLISEKEVRRALLRLGEVPTERELLKAMNSVDPYAHGTVDFQKFLRIMSQFDRSMLTENELINAFKIFDKDQSGSIDAIEMQELMSKLGFKITPLEAHALIAEADDDNSGEVTFTEFVNKILEQQ
mmetsp:Transcript_80523/g.227944  ORF Transcript_80523/g.227944 Transcript_80523/m.227944 type:complete len:179 (-) Transcript_80523:196-732(-)|eukprot:CAMPEP_0168402240 /NCGR_PEP_ID=MMETSP0228-20121227/23519_1 /TAXON_ID=133427 /ORGANISM="Protoceratium reticulatum, Strain CCCM 535 (=CCMP 1889)" /LENGTH=178 /DNA_ID=CAMNT_0008415821 /DNA_START=83 /DNA_END=619 /DNA_ORIENTATION=+